MRLKEVWVRCIFGNFRTYYYRSRIGGTGGIGGTVGSYQRYLGTLQAEQERKTEAMLICG